MTLRLQSTNGPATGAPINNRSRSDDIGRAYPSQDSFNHSADDSSDEEQQQQDEGNIEL